MFIFVLLQHLTFHHYHCSSSNGAPFDKAFYIIIDVSVGGLSGVLNQKLSNIMNATDPTTCIIIPQIPTYVCCHSFFSRWRGAKALE